ncbi:MAG: lipopolysaccharide assembly protein LapA domain-containing protein [Phycisphaerales bacterium]
MKNAKLVAAAIGVILIVIIILQNTAPVGISVLFVETKPIPLAVLLFVAFATGFAAGVVAAALFKRSKSEPDITTTGPD